MQHLAIEIKQSPSEAPNYNDLNNEKGENWLPAKLKKAIIVKKGMQSGLDTVDLQLEGENGEKYVALVSGAILKNLAAAINNG